MGTIKLILKGILLYTTMFVVCITLFGIDWIVDNGKFSLMVGASAFLVYLCCHLINEEELKILTFGK